MSRKLSQRDPAAAYQREAVADRRFPLGSHCACGERRQKAFVSNDPVVCAACDRESQGKSNMDTHHVAGESNSPITVLVPVNDHRAELSVAQYDWPKATLENLNGSPLLARAASVRGFADTTFYLINTLLLPNPDFDERLDAFLTEKLGAGWSIELDSWRPKR